jgi:hypothetical protein
MSMVEFLSAALYRQTSTTGFLFREGSPWKGHLHIRHDSFVSVVTRTAPLCEKVLAEGRRLT